MLFTPVVKPINTKVIDKSVPIMILSKFSFITKSIIPATIKYADTIINAKSIIMPKIKDKRPVLSKI